MLLSLGSGVEKNSKVLAQVVGRGGRLSTERLEER